MVTEKNNIKTFKTMHGLKKNLKQTRIVDTTAKVASNNRLNDLTSKQWIKFLKSWFVFDALGSDLKEERAITKDCAQHPATFSPTMVQEFIEFFTKKQMKVFDPFLGIGSTLVACDRGSRKGYGIEINPEFAEIAQKRTSHNQTIVLGNSENLDRFDLPQMDFCITSPPYWCMLHKIDANQKIRLEKGLKTKYSELSEDIGNITDYEIFLDKLCMIFDKIYDLLKPKGYLVIITQNIIDRSKYYPLAWELALKLSSKPYRYKLKKEKIWCQDHKNLHPFGYPYAWVSNTHHHYCLVFRKE